MPWDRRRTLAYLESHVNLEAVRLGRTDAPTLERMERLCHLMGDPQHAQPVVHVTGTNGKGSTARMISALLAASGLGVGTYTSPDLHGVNERLARGSEPIGDEELAEAIGAVAALEEQSGIRPTRFEILTLAAFRWFADLAVDVAVLEVGMAGRWDATNVADGTVAVVTNVELDHTDILGNSRVAIAREKVGIVKPGATLVLGEDDPELWPVFEGTAAARTWRLGRDLDCVANRVAVGGRALDVRTPGASYSDLYLPLHGAHQGDNATLALGAAEAFFDRPLSEEVVSEALAGVKVAGRFEVVGRHPLVVLDGAHNPDGARAAAATLEDFSVAGDRILVVGLSRGRSPTEMLEALRARHARLVLACSAEWPRAMDPEELAAAARSLGVESEVVRDPGEAVDRAISLASPEDAILVTGSLYVVGPARAARLGTVPAGRLRSPPISS